MTGLGTRVAVGVAMGAVAAVALWLGGVVFWAFVTVLTLVALAEWAALRGADRLRTMVALLFLAVPLVLALPMLWGPVREAVALLAVLAIVLAASAGNHGTGLGIAYLGGAAIGILFLRGEPQGLMLALWTLLVVIATDTGAFFAGRSIGGPKLAPAISPNKTWAGLAGGVIAAGVVGALVAWAGGLPRAMMWLGAPLAVVAQGGDLYESLLKRRAGAKDSGRLLPGHGGVFDRIDGAIPVVMAVALLVAGGAL